MPAVKSRKRQRLRNERLPYRAVEFWNLAHHTHVQVGFQKTASPRLKNVGLSVLSNGILQLGFESLVLNRLCLKSDIGVSRIEIVNGSLQRQTERVCLGGNVPHRDGDRRILSHSSCGQYKHTPCYNNVAHDPSDSVHHNLVLSVAAHYTRVCFSRFAIRRGNDTSTP